MYLLELVNKKKGKYDEEVRLVLYRLITKVKGLNLVPKTSTKTSSSSISALVPRKRISHGVRFLLPYGTKVIEDSFLVVVDRIQYLFIHEPEHGIFYMDESHRIYFKCSDDLAKVSTEHLFYLRTELMSHEKLKNNYHFLKNLWIPDFSWIKPENTRWGWWVLQSVL